MSGEPVRNDGKKGSDGIGGDNAKTMAADPPCTAK
jgi:hypothetical protein